MDGSTATQAKFEGWAIVEMMGHQREVGFVTTEYYGAACMFRVDTPALPEREYVLRRPATCTTGDGSMWCPLGSKVRRPAIPAKSRLVGVPSLYAMTPCTEETALAAIEQLIERPLILLELPAQASKQIEMLPGETPAFDRDESDEFGDDGGDKE